MNEASVCALCLSLLLLAFTPGCRTAAQATDASVVLPLDTANAHLVVELQEATLGTLRLLVDTGAEQSMLTMRAAANAKIDPHLSDRFFTFNGFGQGTKAKLKGHTRLHLFAGGHDLGILDALVLRAGDLDVGVHPQLDGTLGWDFFLHHCVRIDVKQSRMLVSDPQKCAAAEDGFHAPRVEWSNRGLLMPVTITLSDEKKLNLKLHIDTGSDAVVLSPRLRKQLGMDTGPESDSKNSGKGINGSYVFDVVNALAIQGDGGYPTLTGTIPLVVMRKGSYSQPHILFSGKSEAALFRDGVIGNSVLSFFELVFDPENKKLYERAYPLGAQEQIP